MRLAKRIDIAIKNSRSRPLSPPNTNVGYTSVAVTACETDHYILVVFVVMSKEEESIYRRKPYISMILGRISTSANSVEMFQHWQKPKNEAIHNHADSIVNHADSLVI